MSQINLFTGEVEDVIIPIPETEPEAEKPEVIAFDPNEPFTVKRCKRCSQLILSNRKGRGGLCESCDEKLSTKYNQYKNFALIRALRVHKLINR